MTHRTGTGDAHWRRPLEKRRVEGGQFAPPVPLDKPAPDGPAPYSGPPPTTPPPLGWRPPLLVQPAPPRTLPAQNLPRLDAEEKAAQTLTYGFAAVAGAIMLLTLLVLCGRQVLW